MVRNLDLRYYKLCFNTTKNDKKANRMVYNVDVGSYVP